MLTEIKDARQIENEGKRRWFRDDELDLIIWYKGDDTVDGFQLCYDKRTREHALTWHHPDRYEHHSIDDGEAGMVGPKMTPILVADGAVDPDRIEAVFFARSSNLPPEIVTLVMNALKKYHPPG